MDERRDIYAKMSAIMKDIKAVGKDRMNQIQRYSYRGFDDIANMLQPILAKNEVFITSSVLSREQVERVSTKGTPIFCTTLQVKYTFHAPDGSSLDSVVFGEAMDSGDKSTNKAMTFAFKYALAQTFLIPYQMIDGDADSPEVEASPRKVTPEDRKPKYPARQIQDNEARQRLLERNHKLIDECKLDALKISQHLIKNYGASRQYDLTDEQLSHFSEQLRVWRSRINGSNARTEDDHFAQHEAG